MRFAGQRWIAVLSHQKSTLLSQNKMHYMYSTGVNHQMVIYMGHWARENTSSSLQYHTTAFCIHLNSLRTENEVKKHSHPPDDTAVIFPFCLPLISTHFHHIMDIALRYQYYVWITEDQKCATIVSKGFHRLSCHCMKFESALFGAIIP